ncbi:tetratricopeptide repeat protein [Algoriphagus kandeliae]|uniref:Tetratricopeptide repeat protein n=1 Tax=Algoriphagus kandeliae TaxID=2562278 RepID=A0A4Y9QVQ3_9BACT|nr:tetratricopeptide repeat protein [Algoriphagus kandeliae]TFV95542.1 tetratricopeptide repeat protein [Algoriphagus kandeliae]
MKVTLSTILTASFFISLPFLGICQSQNDYDLGIEAFDREDWETAYLHFESWTQQNPADPMGYWYLGQVFEQFDGIESPQLALENYQKAISLNPEMAPVYFSRGRLFLSLGRYEAAEKDFLTYRYLPKGETTQVIYRRSSTDQGFSSITTAQTENPSDVLYYLGLVKLSQKDPETALSYLDSAITFNSNEADFFSEKGNALMDLGRNEEAKLSLKKALELKPNHYLAKQRLLILENGGDRAQLENLTQAISQDPENPQAWKLRGFYKFSQEDWQGALDDFSAAIEIHPEDSENWFYRAKTHAKLKNWEQAERDFSEVLFILENDYETLLGRGQSRYYQNKVEAALADFIQLIALDPEDPSAYYHRGITLHRLERSVEACNDIQKAQELGMMGIESVAEKICGSD